MYAFEIHLLKMVTILQEVLLLKLQLVPKVLHWVLQEMKLAGL